MKKLFFPFMLLYFFNAAAQNVGIGVPAPAEKLDVNGNINLTGTIKANGIAGQPNQLLTTNSAGSLAWGDLCDYKNYMRFRFTTVNGNQTFTVPAGVTKIAVELWGAGGNSVSGLPLTSGGGGGGGAYVKGYLTVNPGDNISIVVGGGASQSIANAGATSVTYNSIFLSAFGGSNATTSSGFNFPGDGGTYFILNTTNYIALEGEAGSADVVRYDQISATDFGRSIHYGDGGNAGNTTGTGGKGGYSLVNVTTSTTISNMPGSAGREPGGGANNRQGSGNGGGNGVVIVHW